MVCAEEKCEPRSVSAGYQNIPVVALNDSSTQSRQPLRWGDGELLKISVHPTYLQSTQWTNQRNLQGPYKKL